MGTALAGKVAIVTGAGRGIGRAYALGLAAEGAKVVVNDLRTDAGVSAADEVVAEIVAAGGEATAATGRVDDFEESREIIAAAERSFGGLDVLIANAGIIRPTFIEESSFADWADVLSVHATGTFNCIHHAIPLMRARGGGSIVTTGDIATDVWFPRISSYRAAKAAILVLTQHAANELRDANINVNSVMPTATDTPMMRTFFASLGEQRESFGESTQGHYDSDASVSGNTVSPSTQPPAGIFLCTDAGRRFTGYSFQMSARKIGVVTPHADVDYVAPAADEWTMSDLQDQIPGLLEGKPSLAGSNRPVSA
ncbi:SDR family NAD(P)-dependent oxidoreductase [Streptomyces sp. NPDC001982]|uniref:SDR family NAD(P)-dependent oxidoreductase n=1 Tax=Streptomyces sp. NPDC001982 TaxID=3154405 RepID=UPI003317DB39